MHKERLKNDLMKNARNGRGRAIFSVKSLWSQWVGLERFSGALKRSFLESLYYRAFTNITKKTLKVCLKGVLRGLKGSFNKIRENVQKGRKYQTRFLGFFNFSSDLRLKKGGIL